MKLILDRLIEQEWFQFKLFPSKLLQLALALRASVDYQPSTVMKYLPPPYAIYYYMSVETNLNSF